jgi:hypothetical protein
MHLFMIWLLPWSLFSLVCSKHLLHNAIKKVLHEIFQQSPSFSFDKNIIYNATYLNHCTKSVVRRRCPGYLAWLMEIKIYDVISFLCSDYRGQTIDVFNAFILNGTLHLYNLDWNVSPSSMNVCKKSKTSTSSQ